jgi:hypothetical protein
MDMNAQKSKYHFVGFLAVLALSFGLISLASETKGFSVNGETTVQGCGTILFGSTEYTGGTSASTSSFSTSGIAIPTIEVSSTFAGSASADQTCRIKNGYITFNFDSTVVTRARIYAYKYGTDADGAMTVSSSADTSGALFSVTNGTAPTLTDLSGTGIYDYTAPDGGLGIASTFLKIACSGTSQRVNLCKILLTLNGVASSSSSSLVSSSSSSPSASSSASTSSVSSSSTTPSGTYQFVASENQIASGGVYAIGNGKTAGSASFMGTTTASSYYRTNVTTTINSDLTMTPDSTVCQLTLGGSSGAWTLSSDTSCLYGNSSYPGDLLYGTASSVNTWSFAFNAETGGVGIQNVATSYYVQNDASYWDCSASSSEVFLYVQKGTIGQTLSASLSSCSLTAGNVNSSISLTASGFSNTPTYAVVAADPSICSAYVDGTSLVITGLAAGSTVLTITASNGEETASTTVTVIAASAEGAFVTLDKSTLSLVATKSSGTVAASSHNISGTVTFSAVSGSPSVASVSINSSTGVVTINPLSEGSATITVTGTNGTDSATASCLVSVAAAPIPTVTLNATSKTIGVSGSGTLSASASGFDNVDAVVFTAHSDNTSACTVSVTNNLVTLTGIAAGSATVTVTGTLGAETASATCAVTVSSYSGTTTQYNPYRIAPVKATGSTAIVYDVEWNASLSRYVATVYKTLNKTTDYIEQADVAAYFEAFEAFPQNYNLGDKNTAISYGVAGRCAWSYIWGSYSGSSDYSVAVPAIVDGATYYELDIGTPSTNSTYNTGSINRGTYRVLAVPGAATHAYADAAWSSGYAPLSLYTTDHYLSFQEYYNHSASFGDLFAGYATTTTSASRVVPTTVTYQVS